MPKRKGSKGGGRPASAYSKLSEDEKKVYHAQAMRTHRGKGSAEPDEHARSDQNSQERESRPRGRPSLGETPMTPNTLRKRRRDLTTNIRQQRSVSQSRQRAALARWHITDETPTTSNTDVVQPSTSTDVVQSSTSTDVVQSSTSANVDWRQLYRLKLRLSGLIPKHPLENIDVFFQSVQYFPCPPVQTKNFKYMSSLSGRQRRYRAQRLKTLITPYGNPVKVDLLKYWLSKLLSDSLIENILSGFQIVFPEEILPVSVQVQRISEALSHEFLSRCRATNEQRKQGTLFAIAVAKKAGLKAGDHGHVLSLASATGSSRKFAKAVLEAIRDKKENELIARNVRNDSIKATDWPLKISEFVLQPDIARAVPGNDTISVRYGVRRPKFLLLDSKMKLAEQFKERNPECPFSINTIMREFPQNAVTPTNRDLERNTCPIHANARRLIKCLHLNDVAKDTNPSCRLMVIKTMCSDENVDPEDPLTWNKDCVYGDCSNCPAISVKIPEGHDDNMVTFSQWTYQVSKEKGKKVFGLYEQRKILSEAVKDFVGLLPKLRKHIFTAHHQWQAHAVSRCTLDKHTVITVEDYQQNLEVIYPEAPTSMAYSTNKFTVAVYPICLEYLNEKSDLEKAAIVFISDDKKHDFQQVQAFEKRMFEIAREKCPHEIKNWQRFTDGCASQFRSRKVNAKLLAAKDAFDLEEVAFEYFEANEGKNISDTIGSIVKCAFQRGIAKHNEGISTSSDIVRIIRSEVKDATSKFSFFVVEEFQGFQRVDQTSEFPLPGILSIHSLKVKQSGILARKLTCTACSPSRLCDSCTLAPASVSAPDNSMEGTHPPVHDLEDDGATDMSDESDDESVHDALGPGDIVWAKYGRAFYPAKVVHPKDVPTNQKRTLLRSVKDTVLVKWYGEERISRVKSANVETLAENKVDAYRASRNERILRHYQLALSDLRNE